MASSETADPGNPISRVFEAQIHDNLGQHIGETITPELIETLSAAVLSVELQFCGVSGAAELLEVSRQRIRQLSVAHKLPEPAGKVGNMQIWLMDDMVECRDQRRGQVEKWIKDTYRWRNQD